MPTLPRSFAFIAFGIRPGLLGPAYKVNLILEIDPIFIGIQEVD